MLRGMLVFLTLFCLGFGSCLAQANTPELPPLPADARVQLQLTDKRPAVVHYYTRLSPSELLAFYQQQLGAPTTQKMQMQHLQLYFQHDGQRLRVVIREQDGWRDVSLMLQ